MWACLIAGVLYRCKTRAELVLLLRRDKEVRMICGFNKGYLPGDDALGRFLKKLVKHEALLEECFRELVKRLRQLVPDFGVKPALDSTDIKAYSNSHRENPSDSDDRRGAKGAGYRAGKGTTMETSTIGLVISFT